MHFSKSWRKKKPCLDDEIEALEQQKVVTWRLEQKQKQRWGVEVLEIIITRRLEKRWHKKQRDFRAQIKVYGLTWTTIIEECKG